MFTDEAHLVSDLYRVLPVFLLLVDIQQQRQHGRQVYVAVDQLLEQSLRTIEQARLHIVLSELKNRICTLLGIQRGTCHQVLVNANGAIYLATFSEQVAQCQMGFNGVAVDLEHANEDINRLVLLLIEKIVKPLDIFFPEHGVRTAARLALASLCGEPAKRCGDR